MKIKAIGQNRMTISIQSNKKSVQTLTNNQDIKSDAPLAEVMDISSIGKGETFTQ